jgi:hypothetical protein
LQLIQEINRMLEEKEHPVGAQTICKWRCVVSPEIHVVGQAAELPLLLQHRWSAPSTASWAFSGTPGDLMIFSTKAGMVVLGFSAIISSYAGLKPDSEQYGS